ncbi:fumarylacetoacetate hydrolase family protein [Bacillus sp. H-16]|uniref:fumarylacetoacetate hydrolase family protein n=1 Tax=Alteribacter salitolerans TaxID=2912333 RepID=UPI0019644A81|nr:fumarylacetoacetate hydrolase family protein [Alteribacter salitolerans]
MENIKNIFCIGRNYAKHAEELGNQIPKSPLIFSKPTGSLVKAENQDILFPSDRGPVHYEAEIVLFIGKEVGSTFEVEDVVDKMALGIDFTLRDEQTRLKEKGHPWLKAKGFKNAALVTEFWPFPGLNTCQETDFTLVQNGNEVQRGNIQNMMFDFHRIIKDCHDLFGLAPGDIIYTGTPEGVGQITAGDEYVLKWGEKEKGRFTVNKYERTGR